MVEGRAGRWGYRPYLDGLRAVAVYLVVAFHAGIGRLAGGFIGVDVFFVLSGYLVTNLLLRDLTGPQQAIRFGRFYARRARRLLPAAAVALVVTAVVYSALATPAELVDARHAIRAASLYFANWFFIHQASDYFAADIGASPVLHFWSLSVEEQFYLVWPLALGGLFAVTRRLRARQVAVVRVVVVVLGTASAVAALRLAGDQLNRAYYGTDTRAYQLLAGAAVALTPGLVTRLRRLVPVPVLGLAGVALVLGLCATGTTLVDVNAIQRGVLTAVLAATLIAVLEASDGGLGQRVLSLPPIVYLGKISYGTYLWHWLVIVVISRKAPMSHVSTFLLASAIATGLASLSFQLLEQPVRSAAVLDRLRPVVIGSGLALSLLVGLAIVPAVVERSTPSATAVEAPAAPAGVAGGSKVDPAWQSAYFDYYDSAPCEKGGVHACELTKGTGRTAIVIGDSHAQQLTPMLVELARQRNLHLYAAYLPYCPWTRGVRYAGVGGHCFADQDKAFDTVVPKLDPDLVFLVHRPFDDVREPFVLDDRDVGLVPVRETARRAQVLRRRVTAVVDDLRADGRDVVMVEPLPVVAKEDNPLTCLSTAKVVEECRFVTSTDPGPEATAMRAAAKAGGGRVVSVDMDPMVCPYLPICDPVVDGLVVRRDANHITTTFGVHLLPRFEAVLVAAGILPRR